MKAAFFLLSALLLFSASCQPQTPEKYIPRSKHKREKYATPEPGTYLRPVSYALLQEINRIREEPESFKEPADWVRKMFVSHLKRELDTLISYGGLKVPVRIYYPGRTSLKGGQPVILFIHGGAFVMGSVEDYHIMVSKLARITGQIIVSVEYHLAPEYPFPAGLDDCFAVFCWLQDHGSEVGADTGRISVMGDSAGGNLATVITLRSRDEGRPQPRCQILVYPGVTFLETPYPSRQYFGHSEGMDFVLTEAFLRKVKREYMYGETNERNPYLSPLEAELTPDLAPALIITAECDPIRDDGRYYAAKLDSIGVQVDHIEYSGTIHGFMSFHMILREALDAMKYIDSYLERI
jgi:acetyl esterase